MKLLKHEISKIAGEMPRELVLSALTEAVDTARDCKHVYECLLKKRDSGYDEYDLTEEIEAYSSFNITNLNFFGSCAFSASPMVNKYLSRTLRRFNALQENLKTAIDLVFCISADDIDALIRQAYDVVSGMSFFCLVEFNLFDSMTDDFNEVEELDEIVFSYCQTNLLNPDDFLNELLEFAKEFKPKFDVFDSYEELEPEFQRIMGPSIVGVDESALTIDHVKQIISGTISPEELVALLNSEEDSEV